MSSCRPPHGLPFGSPWCPPWLHWRCHHPPCLQPSLQALMPLVGNCLRNGRHSHHQRGLICTLEHTPNGENEKHQCVCCNAQPSLLRSSPFIDPSLQGIGGWATPRCGMPPTCSFSMPHYQGTTNSFYEHFSDRPGQLLTDSHLTID
jgi:hypothetical protein